MAHTSPHDDEKLREKWDEIMKRAVPRVTIRRAALLEVSGMATTTGQAVHRLDAQRAAVSDDGVVVVPAGHDTIEYDLAGGKATNLRTRRADR